MICLRGRPFDTEGGGACKFGRDRLFIFIMGMAGKKYFRVNRGQNINFQPQQFLEKAYKMVSFYAMMGKFFVHVLGYYETRRG